MPEYTGYIHERCGFDLKLLKDKNAIVVQETCEDGRPHYHFWLNDPRKEGGLRKWFCQHFAEDRGAKAYSLKLCDSSKKESYFRYICKGEDEESKPNVIHNAPRIDVDKYHKLYYAPENHGKTKGTKKQQAFSFTLVEVFKEKHLNEYTDSYLVDHYNKYSPYELRSRRMEFLSKVVITTLDAHTKVIDPFIIKRFVLLLESRFNHEAFKADMSSKIADSIMLFGN